MKTLSVGWYKSGGSVSERVWNDLSDNAIQEAKT